MIMTWNFSSPLAKVQNDFMNIDLLYFTSIIQPKASLGWIRQL